MATCPSGHQSASDDFCDVCGIRIDAAAFSETGAEPAAASPGHGVPPAAPVEVCPRCGISRTGQFCEACGHDFTAATAEVKPQPTPPPAPAAAATAAAWTAVVTADRAYYDRVRAAEGPDNAMISFPAYCPERRFLLSGTEVQVGRRSVSRGIDPEIDLTGPPTDPGVSRLHAVFVAAQDGTWSIVDPGSANGILVNGTEIPPGEAVPLRHGDRIHLGAWTALTVTRGAQPARTAHPAHG
jgi:hypothetical protein